MDTLEVFPLFSVADTNSIWLKASNPSIKTDIAKSPLPKAVLSMRLLIKHQTLPSPEQHTIPDMMGSSSQAATHSPRWMWTKPASVHVWVSLRLPARPAQPIFNDAAGAVVSTPRRGAALGSLSPAHCRWPTARMKAYASFGWSGKVTWSNPIAQNTKVSCCQGQWKLWVEIFRKNTGRLTSEYPLIPQYLF